MWTILLREKSEAFQKFKKLREVVEKETGEKIATFRTDRGREFVSNEFNEYFQLAGIRRHLTAPYTPQQKRGSSTHKHDVDGDVEKYIEAYAHAELSVE